MGDYGTISLCTAIWEHMVIHSHKRPNSRLKQLLCSGPGRNLWRWWHEMLLLVSFMAPCFIGKHWIGNEESWMCTRHLQGKLSISWLFIYFFVNPVFFYLILWDNMEWFKGNLRYEFKTTFFSLPHFTNCQTKKGNDLETLQPLVLKIIVVSVWTF